MNEIVLTRPGPTLLDHAPAPARRSDPYSYLVFDDVLPHDTYEALAHAYPNPRRLDSKLLEKSNQRYNLVSGWGAAEFPLETASPEWQAFIAAHESARFASQVLEQFPDHCVTGAAEPTLDVDKLGEGLARDLGIDPAVQASDLVARATVACNTPVTQVSRVRGVHADAKRKAYVGLLYFRLPEDDSEGGDLQIHRWKPGARRERWPVKVEEGQTECVETVAYKANRLVLFITGENALHAVSPRTPTSHFRRLVVVSGWLPNVDYYDTDTMHGKLRGLRGRALSAVRRSIRSFRNKSGSRPKSSGLD